MSIHKQQCTMFAALFASVRWLQQVGAGAEGNSHSLQLPQLAPGGRQFAFDSLEVDRSVRSNKAGKVVARKQHTYRKIQFRLISRQYSRLQVSALQYCHNIGLGKFAYELVFLWYAEPCLYFPHLNVQKRGFLS
jgi:hypothetical protein